MSACQELMPNLPRGLWVDNRVQRKKQESYELAGGLQQLHCMLSMLPALCGESPLPTQAPFCFFEGSRYLCFTELSWAFLNVQKCAKATCFRPMGTGREPWPLPSASKVYRCSIQPACCHRQTNPCRHSWGVAAGRNWPFQGVH